MTTYTLLYRSHRLHSQMSHGPRSHGGGGARSLCGAKGHMVPLGAKGYMVPLWGAKGHMVPGPVPHASTHTIAPLSPHQELKQKVLFQILYSLEIQHYPQTILHARPELDDPWPFSIGLAKSSLQDEKEVCTCRLSKLVNWPTKS